MLELYNDRLIDLLAPHGKEVSFDSENSIFPNLDSMPI